jgi:solute carrier family 25 (mitochondrial aspartate/glutamate transporter), member 12/13
MEKEKKSMFVLQKKDCLATSQSTAAVSLPQKLLVGASAGIFGTSIIYPIDVMKTQLQTSSQRISLKTLSSVMRNVSNGGLYRGFSACLIGIAPEKALKLTVNDFIRDFYSQGERSIQLTEEMLAGSLAGMIQLIVTVPYESVKIKLQMGGATSATDAIQKMGLRGLYTGFSATFLRDVPFCLLFFPLYAQLKAWQLPSITSNSSPYSSSTIQMSSSEASHIGLVAGIGAGAISATLVTPADMLKTRIQQGYHGQLGLIAYAKQIIRTEGMSALFKGWQARVLVIAPLYGIVSLAFELQKKLLGL